VQRPDWLEAKYGPKVGSVRTTSRSEGAVLYERNTALARALRDK
jgi:hypothetical protein